MKIKGEKFIEMKDVVSVYQSQLDTFCINELGKVSMKIGVNVNEEKLKKWIDQAKFIEKFSVEDIKDGATRDLVYKTQQENQALKDRWQKLKEWVERKYTNDSAESNDINSPFEARDYYGASAGCCELILNKMQELEKEIK